MADRETLSRLKKGPEEWNRWRAGQPFFRPDLRGADLTGMSLQRAHLDGADLDESDLSGSSLSGARLAAASLERVVAVGAQFRETAMSDVRLSAANLENADLHSADLNGATLDDTLLLRANFESANLSLATLARANLTEARLVGAKMNDTDLSETDLRGAQFGARYQRGELPQEIGNDLGQALAKGIDIGGLLRHTARTSLCNVDLSTARNLKTASHDGPTSVGIDTLMLTAESLFGREDRELQAGAIEIFLRGAGVHEEALRLFPILLRHPVFYSVFVSYSRKDIADVKKLEERLLKAGVKVWRDESGKEVGAGISATLQAAIAKHDRVLLICSKASLGSDWVGDEIRHATQEEQETGRRNILIPLFLDDSIEEWTKRETGLLADRFGLDFRTAESDPAQYERLINELLGSLRTVRS